MKKSTYQAPKLVRLGSVSDLTQNGQTRSGNDSKLGSNHVTWSE
ncbi:MAG: lasso RiPP family leader peptide-containing protein [Trueperaceae bacterium]